MLDFLSLSTYEKPDSHMQLQLRATVLRFQQWLLTEHTQHLMLFPLDSSGHEDLVLRPTALGSLRLPLL